MKKTILKHSVSTATLFVFALLFFGSATQKKLATPMKVPIYTFKPPSTAPAKSAKIAFLVINPHYATSFKYSNAKLFIDFANSMSADFEQALTAKGYSVRGPYPTYDEVIYSDKKETDLMLLVEIALEVDETNVLWTPHTSVNYYNGANTVYYTCSGFITLGGKVHLTASETLTKEKLWSQNIPLEQRRVNIEGEKTYPYPNELTIALNEDAGAVNPMVDVLEDFYKSVFNTAWNHLDPQELTPLKTQVDEIRAKSNLIQH